VDLQPEVAASARLCVSLVAVVMAVSMIQVMPGSSAKVVRLTGTLAVAAVLMGQTGSMVAAAAGTVKELSEYGKLLLPVMAGTLASQGGVTSSAALYAGTAIFDALLTAGITTVLIPLIYVFLALSTAACATGLAPLEKLRGFVKWLASWFLKTVLYIFTGYISITGVVSGTADVAALKATKLTMSGMIPVVGGILSEASEAVLVGAGLVKSAAGIYGLLAVTAIWIAPFLRIGIRYLLLKLTAAVCETFGVKEISNLITAFSEAIGLLLGMTGSISIMLLISTVCFMKGVG
jgi:stage III sporulation protein AE